MSGRPARAHSQVPEHHEEIRCVAGQRPRTATAAPGGVPLSTCAHVSMQSTGYSVPTNLANSHGVVPPSGWLVGQAFDLDAQDAGPRTRTVLQRVIDSFVIPQLSLQHPGGLRRLPAVHVQAAELAHLLLQADPMPPLSWSSRRICAHRRAGHAVRQPAGARRTHLG